MSFQYLRLMKKSIRTGILMLFSFLSQLAVTQHIVIPEELQSSTHMAIEELQLPSAYSGLELPAMVDNSQTPFFRPIFNQIGASCGQASSIGYLFTYEMCRKREVPASLSFNQYPSHFAYNFMSYDGYYGVNYLHSMEIVKAVGTPDLNAYGGMAIDDGVVWKSGYDLYYNAMCNRAAEIKMIRTGTEQGLLMLKHWLAHHNEGTAVGGVANFASGTPYNLVTIPPGNPEAGKKIVTAFPGTVATHAMTIVGYNDSIRYDVNNDGQFTNHLDINGDGVVDMRDWEIGALKIANSYGDTWGNQGFYYALYRTLALNEYNGGMWGNMVHVMDVKKDYRPQLAIKVNLKHNLREQIKVRAGVSADPSSTIPEHLLDFPVFNYQGGKHYMQGGTSNEAHKIIEFGLDITPLLSFVEPGKPAAFFLEVLENDPYSTGNGEIIAFSLMDYATGALIEVPCAATNTPLVNNTSTLLKIIHQPVFETVDITTEEIPLFDNSFRMEAIGGSLPYNWKLLTPYHQQMTTLPMPQASQQQLLPEEPYNKFATKALGFSFPFYGEHFDTVYVNKAGFILFEKDIFPWRYLRDSYHLFREMKNISAFLFAPVLFYEGTKSQKGIWYEGDETHATFRWNLDLVYYDNFIGEGEFAVTLYPDGSIDFFYNNIEVDENVLWYAGVSAGQGTEFTLLKGANSRDFYENCSFRLTPELIPEGISLSRDGLLTANEGLPQNCAGLSFQATDQRGISGFKVLEISNDLRWNCRFNTTSGKPPSNGSEVKTKLSLTNIGSLPIQISVATLSSDDPYFVPLDTLATDISLASGENFVLEDAFSFKVKPECPDGHTIFVQLHFLSSIGERFGRIAVPIGAGELDLTNYYVNDHDNHLLDPGETTQLVFKVSNFGSLPAFGVKASLASADPFVTIGLPAQQDIGTLEPGMSDSLSWTVHVSPNCPIEHIVLFEFSLSDSLGFETVRELSFRIGQYIALIVAKSTDPTSAQAVAATLDSLSLQNMTVNVIDSSIDKYRAVFVCQGTYGTTISLSPDEVELLKTYLNQGGNVYRESFYSWLGTGFFPTYFGVEQKDIANPQTFSHLAGIQGTTFAEVEADFSGPVNFMLFRLMPANVSASALMTTDIAPDAWTTVGNETANYKTIAALYEFGYFGQSAQTEKRLDLMKAILRFFKMDHLMMGNQEVEANQSAERFVKVFPNPFEEAVYFTVSQDNISTIQIDLFAADGRQLFSEMAHPLDGSTLRWTASGRLAALKAGLYFFRFTDQKRVALIPLLKK